MRSILALAAVLAVLVGGGVAVASPTSASKPHAAKPAAKAPASATTPHRCHNSDGSGSTTSAGL
jgi:hypothetical protein